MVNGKGRRQRQRSVLDVAKEVEDIVVLSLSDALIDVLGFGFGSRLHEFEELTELVSFGFEDLIATAQRRPTTFALFGFIVAFGSKALTAETFWSRR